MRSLLRPIRTRRDRGAVIPVVALALTMLMTMTAFAVDLGRMRTERRDLQADADAIALDSVQIIRGLSGPTAQAAAVTEANLSAVRNGLSVTLTDNEVKVGVWDVPTQTFTYTGDNAAITPDAVQVILDSTVEMFFDFSTDERAVSRTSVAVARAQTMGELGSVVAGVQPEVDDPTEGCAVGVAASVQMTVMNHFYSELLGITVAGGIEGEVGGEIGENVSCQVSGPDDGLKLDVASYQGLAASRVTFRDLASAAGVGSPNELLDLDLTQAEMLDLTAAALQSGEDPTSLRYQVGSQLISIASEIDTATQLQVLDILRSSTGGEEAAAEASLTALDLLLATATAIDGNNFIGGDGTLTVPLPLGTDGTQVDVPAKVHVIEPPQMDQRWKFAGQDGPETSQVSVALSVPLDFDAVPVDLSHLSILGLSNTATVTGTGSLPLVIEVGKATSRYPQITCPADGTPAGVLMEVTSGAARVQLGTTTDGDFSDGISVTTPGSLATEGSATVSVLGIPTSVSLNTSTNVPSLGQSFDGAGAYTLDTDAGLSAGGGVATNPFSFTPPGPTEWFRYRGGLAGVEVTDSVISSFDFGYASEGLIGTLTILQSRLVRNAIVQGVLDPVVSRIDDTVLQPLFNALGVTVGGADARIHNVRCSVPALANRP